MHNGEVAIPHGEFNEVNLSLLVIIVGLCEFIQSPHGWQYGNLLFENILAFQMPTQIDNHNIVGSSHID